MKPRDSSVYVGGLLVLLGGVLLLQNMGLFGPIESVVWTAVFSLGGATFLSVVVQNRERWWALIPAALLFSIATLLAFNEIAPTAGKRWGGSLLLGGFSLGFWAIAVLKRDGWWAVIPAGVLSTLAVVAGLDQVAAESLAGATLFAGLALTFGLVYLLRRGAGPAVWALIVASGALLMAVAILSASVTFVGLLWPLVIIVGGVALLVRALRSKEPQKEVEHYENPTLPQSH